MNNNTENLATLVGTAIGFGISVAIQYFFIKGACKDAIREVHREEAKQRREEVE